jgi:hypothetical protein
MARVHAKHTVIIIDDVTDVGQWCNDSTVERSSGTEDNTLYGDDDIVKDGTLKTGVCSFGGKYDDDASGPRAVLMPLIGEKVNIKYRPEGTGSGKPQDSFDAVITKYVETAPVAGYRAWTCETEPSGPWDQTDQT